jgi:hypothetical protein
MACLASVVKPGGLLVFYITMKRCYQGGQTNISLIIRISQSYGQTISQHQILLQDETTRGRLQPSGDTISNAA